MTEKTISDIGEFGLIKLISHDLIYRPEFVKIGPGMTERSILYQTDLIRSYQRILWWKVFISPV